MSGLTQEEADYILSEMNKPRKLNLDIGTHCNQCGQKLPDGYFNKQRERFEKSGWVFDENGCGRFIK